MKPFTQNLMHWLFLSIFLWFYSTVFIFKYIPGETQNYTLTWICLYQIVFCWNLISINFSKQNGTLALKWKPVSSRIQFNMSQQKLMFVLYMQSSATSKLPNRRWHHGEVNPIEFNERSSVNLIKFKELNSEPTLHDTDSDSLKGQTRKEIIIHYTYTEIFRSVYIGQWMMKWTLIDQQFL